MITLFDIQPNNVDSDTRNAWYTPAKYIEAARRVMGGIDLDPASCEMANRTVKAEKYYTQEDNGLAHEWYGRVWCNPPYGRMYKTTGTSAFVSRVIDDYTKGNIEQAIVLTMVGMYASWFFKLLQYPVCFLEEKPLFCSPDGMSTEHGFAACCTYIGPNKSAFVDEFEKFGVVTEMVSTPKQKTALLSLWEGGV